MRMLDYIYDSLETVKNLKFPGVKTYVTLTIAIFAVVIIAWIYFIITDYVFQEGYKALYDGITNVEEVITGTVAE